MNRTELKIITTNLTTGRDIVAALRNMPEDQKHLLLAAGGGYELHASRNRFINGAAFKIVAPNKAEYSFAGLNDCKKEGLLLAELIVRAERYIHDMLTNPMVQVPPMSPVTAKDNLRSAVQRMRELQKAMSEANDTVNLSRATMALDDITRAFCKLP